MNLGNYLNRYDFQFESSSLYLAWIELIGLMVNRTFGFIYNVDKNLNSVIPYNPLNGLVIKYNLIIILKMKSKSKLLKNNINFVYKRYYIFLFKSTKNNNILRKTNVL